MALRDDPSRASDARDTALQALKAEGVTGRVRDEDGKTVADLDIPIEEIGDQKLPIVEVLPEAFVTAWLADPADQPWTGAGESRVDFGIRRDGALLRLQGEAQVGLRHTCVRCLEEVPFDIPLQLDLHLVAGLDSGSLTANGSDVELSHGMEGGDDALDDTDLIHFDGQTVRFGEILREQVFLETPMNPTCGGEHARVREECSLDQDGALAEERSRWKDPRWAALEGLRDQLPEE
jgi:uncharacterized metal-binding protein YceD (DUF177 family)